MEKNMRANRRMTMVLVPMALVAAGWWLAGSGQARAQAGIAGDTVLVGDDGEVNVFYVGDDETAYLGVQLEEETEYEEGGARVTQVVEDSPAEQAGLEDGDIIVSFDGATVRGPAGLTKMIHEREPGETVSITVMRNGRKKRVEVELGDRASLWKPLAYAPFMSPDFDERLREQLEKNRDLLQRHQLDLDELGDRFRFFGDCDGDDCDLRSFSVWFGKPKLGVQLVEATPELRRHLGGGDDAGVLVSKVLAGTPAEAADVRVGDLIVSVEGEEIATSNDLRRELADKTGERFELEVIRDGRPVRLEVTIPDPEEDAPTGPRAELRAPLPVPPVAPVPAPVAAPVPPAVPAPLTVPVPPAIPAPPAPPAAPRSVV